MFLESCSVVFGAPALKLAIFGPKFQLYCLLQLHKILKSWHNMSLLCLIKLTYPWQLVFGVRDTFLESCSVVFGALALQLAIFGPKFQLFCFLQLDKIVKGWWNMSFLCLIKLIYPWQLVLGVREWFLESCSVVFGPLALKLAIFGPKFHLFRPLEAQKMVKFECSWMFRAWHKLFFQ